jgi:hypothetical protein
MQYTWLELKWWMRQLAKAKARTEQAQLGLLHAAIWGAGKASGQPSDNQD